MNVKFKRALDTGDGSQDTVLTQGTHTWIASHSPTTDSLVKHASGDKTSFSINFTPETGCTGQVEYQGYCLTNDIQFT